MNTETISLGILRCDACGAPMYPNPARQAFYCPFCGNEAPFGKRQPRLRYNHRKLEITEEGYICLKRVAVMTRPSGNEELLAARRW